MACGGVYRGITPGEIRVGARGQEGEKRRRTFTPSCER